MLSDLLAPPRLHTRTVTACVALFVLGQALTFWLLHRGIENHVRQSVQATLITAERGLKRQLHASPLDQAATSSHDTLMLVRDDNRSAWRLQSSTLAPPVAQAALSQWLQSDLADERVIMLPQGEHLARAFTLSATTDAHEIKAIVLGSLDASRAQYQSMKHALLAWSAMGVVAFGLVVMGLLYARRLISPLRRLSSKAERLKRGAGGGEVDELTESLETMRQALHHRDGQILRLSTRDRLTDLPNREHFRKELRLTLEQADLQPTSILVLDMDRFKQVNDQLGHRFGDALLKAIAERLRIHAKSRPRAVLARMGGDEFGLLLPRTDAVTAHRLAQQIMADFESSTVIDGQKIDLSAGIGIASSPDHGQDGDTLLSHAEVAMYAAKRRRAGAVVYHPELEADSASSLTLLGELRQAVEQGELRLFLQPKVSLHSGQVVGAEALVRWEHPVRGVLPPHGFVPFAEQTGFVRLLTGWMLEEVTLTARQLSDTGLNLKLSVNLSTRDLMDQSLPDRLDALIERHGVPPDRLVLEITESAIMDDPQRAQRTLERLHDMGLRLSIDDFGTGYASLAYLKALPVDELKIDRSFVQDMALDGHDAKIVSSTIELAHSLGLTVVAEGVEDLSAWHHLASLGCDEAQGHLVARPMPANQFQAWANAWRPPA